MRCFRHEMPVIGSVLIIIIIIDLPTDGILNIC